MSKIWIESYCRRGRRSRSGHQSCRISEKSKSKVHQYFFKFRSWCWQCNGCNWNGATSPKNGLLHLTNNFREGHPEWHEGCHQETVSVLQNICNVQNAFRHTYFIFWFAWIWFLTYFCHRPWNVPRKALPRCPQMITALLIGWSK